MKNAPEAPAIAAPVLWERPEPKGPLSPLSRDLITRVAIAIADKDGLVGVSLRKVAASLDATTMRLYGYLTTKEELLELMVDAVYGEMLGAGPPGEGWREVLRDVAHRVRQAERQHKWFIELLGGRPHLGPNAMASLEAWYATLDGTHAFESIDAIMQAVSTVNAYAIGALRGEANDVRADREDGVDPAKRRAAWWPYLRRLIATGRFPMMARIVREASHPPAEVEFERGLDCVLAGIAQILCLERPD
jgi:AcrR family transcriptional regulator